MIRMNLAVLSIAATLAWIITGMVHAGSPITTQMVGATTSNSPALWHGVDNTRRKPASTLRKRTPKQKPSRISWPEGATEARLLIKFNDELKVRLDSNGQVFSQTGNDLESFNVVLDGLQLSLQPVYNTGTKSLETIINRAEMLSGEAQPDLAGTYYVVGTPRDMDAAGTLLLKDPRLEWAQFTPAQADPLQAVAQRKQELIDSTIASILNDVVPPAAKPVPLPDARPTVQIDTAPPAPGRGLDPSVGACCVTEDDILIEPMISGVPEGPTNPRVVKVCNDQNYNATSCADIDGKFGGPGTTCENPFNDDSTPNLRFYSCNLNASIDNPNGAPGWQAIGACCDAGDCDVVPQGECEGIFLDTFISRFTHAYHPLVGEPVLNQNLNIQLLASLYGMENFVQFDLGGNVVEANSNSNYTYYSGVPAQGTGPIVVRTQNTGQYLLELPSTNYTASDLVPANYRTGLVDYNADTRQPAWENAALPDLINPLGATSGGFTYANNGNASGNFYNPNFYIACLDVTCQFGVCALPCWDPADCAQTRAGTDSTLPSSPIMTGGVGDTVPSTNVTCGNFIHEQACDGMQFRSTTNAFNLTGSIFQNLATNEPAVPQAVGCQIENRPSDETLRWFEGVFDPASDFYCPSVFADNGSVVELYEPAEDAADILYGTCFYSHLTYPTMVVNPVGLLQLQGIAGCYGEFAPCPAQCVDVDLSGRVCSVAPSCCDFTLCEDTQYNGYAGWSFFCADLANQFTRTGAADQTNIYYTDFNQQLKVGGPYPEFNSLGITAVVQRDINGQPIIDPATGLPTVLQAPTKCQITYGVQNQCLTPYFSPFQPTLSDRSEEINGGSDGRTTQGGCADFECCHRVCSIVEPDPATGFNYRSCCTQEGGWIQPCVDKAKEICYYDQNGVFYNDTPDFTPLQFNLSQNVARGISTLPIPLRRLVAAPLLPPSIISPQPGNPSIPADNWIQSVHQLAWTSNPYLIAAGGNPATNAVANSTTVAALTVSGQGNRIDRGGNSEQLGLQYNTVNGQIEPTIPSDPVNWDQFYYGNPPVLPVAWFGSQGLSLYGNTVGQPWSTNPSFLSPSFGLYSWGAFLAELNPGFHPWGAYTNGTSGAGIRIAVIDTAAWLQEYADDFGVIRGAVHEDLGNVILEGPALGYPEVDMLFDPFVTQPQRGTAVLGAIGAGPNGFGVTGIAPQAELLFFPTVSASTGVRETDAWVHAIESLGYGDILIASYPGTSGSQCLVEESESIRELIALASASGITVVLPAGDVGTALDGSLGALEDTGACIVGASLPSNTPHRFWSSNYSINPNNTFNPLLPIASGTAPITTTGGDCNLTMAAINTEDDSPLGDPSGFISRDIAARSYTNNFGGIFNGSKAAAAQAAATAACLQGFSLQRYGIPQTPALLRRLLWKSGRDLLSEPNSDGDGQGGANAFPVFGGGGYQFDLSAPVEEGAPEVGGYLDPANAGVYMVVDPEFALDSSEYLYDYKFIRGIQQFGMIFSLEEDDDNYLIALSQPTARGGYTPDFEVPGAPIKYLSTGDYTDLYIQGVDPSDRDFSGGRSIIVDAVWPESSISEVYMYSYTAERWLLCPSVHIGAGEETVTFEVAFPQQYFGDDGYFHVRIVTHTGPVGPGGNQSGGGTSGFLMRYDLFDFGPSGPQGGQDGAGG